MSFRKLTWNQKRLRRLNSLLVTIAFIFAVCWMPLNVYNLVLDLYNPFQKPEDQETMLIIYAVCHVLGMFSACANPWLYGWYNDNFRNEFHDIVGPLLRCFGRHCPALATSISVSRSSSRQRAVQRPDGSANGINGGGVMMGGAGALNEENECSQTRACIDDDDNLPHLINNIQMTSMQMNQLTCEVEMTYSSCVQSTIQSSDMLWSAAILGDEKKPFFCKNVLFFVFCCPDNILVEPHTQQVFSLTSCTIDILPLVYAIRGMYCSQCLCTSLCSPRKMREPIQMFPYSESYCQSKKIKKIYLHLVINKVDYIPLLCDCIGWFSNTAKHERIVTNFYLTFRHAPIRAARTATRGVNVCRRQTVGSMDVWKDVV